MQRPIGASEGKQNMPSKRLSVTVTRRLPDAVETRMRELFNVTLRQDDTPMSDACTDGHRQYHSRCDWAGWP